ncbi:MAG: SH3 domain-containing protein [Chloroflexi bacterium]|nr:SH3 domain-containing protein [Chloroflexota bacterium]
MTHRRPLLFAIATLILATLACNAFAGNNPEPPLELPPPAISDLTGTPSDDSPTPAGLAPTATLPGGATVDPALDSGDPTARVLVDLNVRTGPGVQYDRVGFVLANERVPILGQDPASGWWKISCPARINDTTECWISGGGQYSEASNGGAVPVAAVPPTPTPQPTATPVTTSDASAETAVVPATAHIAYADSSGVWVIGLDVSQNPPAAAAPVQIAAIANATSVLLSPDGQKVAYVTGGFDANTLAVVNVDGNNSRTLVQSESVAALRAVDTAQFSTLIVQVQWLADSRGLAFNTSLNNLTGPGSGSQEDLWTVSIDGELVERLVPGNGGGAFDISGNGRVIAGASEGIMRSNLDGSDLELMIPFELVNTASEYIYYPQPKWTADGSRAYVAVPNREQFSADANFSLWEIPSSGPAVKLTEVSGNILFGGVHWTDNGNRVAYISSEIGTGALPDLVVAAGNGSTPVDYTTDPQLTFGAWSPDGNSFLYAGADYYAVGKIDAPPTQVVISGGTAVIQWLDASNYIVVIGTTGAWQIQSSNMAGDTSLLTTISSQSPAVDVWIP